jgi:hypothetical protein
VHLKTRTYHVFLQLRMGWDNDGNLKLRRGGGINRDRN